MQYVYDMARAEPIIRDMLVYDAANLDQGELLMLDSATNPTMAITAYNATAANSAVDVIGVLNEETYQVTKHDGTAGTTPDTTLANGGQYGKVIINPGAVFRGEYTLGTVAATSAATTVTQASITDVINGGFCYAAGNVNGELRYITAGAAGTFDVKTAFTSALAAGDFADVIVKSGNYSSNLTADGKNLNGTGANAGTCTNIRVVESYIDRDNGIEPLRYATHQPLDNLEDVKGSNGPKFYSDLVMKDHAFGAQE